MGGAAARQASKTVGDIKKYVQEFTEEWIGKVTSLNEIIDKTRQGVASIASGVAQNLGGLKAHLDINSEAIEQFDIFNQIWAQMLLRMIERQELESTPEDTQGAKTRAREWFEGSYREIRDQVLEARQAELAARRAEAEAKAKEEEQAKKEESVADETLRSAEKSINVPGGQGSDIPVEAEVFGG